MLIAAYCASGPYRHQRELLTSGSRWVPWGCRSGSIADGLRLRPGDLLEIWEIDDTRRPRSASPKAVGAVDFVSETDGYCAFTVNVLPDHVPQSASGAVLSLVRRGHLLGSLPAGNLAERRSTRV